LLASVVLRSHLISGWFLPLQPWLCEHAWLLNGRSVRFEHFHPIVACFPEIDSSHEGRTRLFDKPGGGHSRSGHAFGPTFICVIPRSEALSYVLLPIIQQFFVLAEVILRNSKRSLVHLLVHVRSLNCFQRMECFNSVFLHALISSSLPWVEMSFSQYQLQSFGFSFNSFKLLQVVTQYLLLLLTILQFQPLNP